MIFNALARLQPGARRAGIAEATAHGGAAPSLGQAGLALFGSSGGIAVTVPCHFKTR